ncbi:MAG TPA: helix-turn-helix domain-containing protein [Tepidisphaeraceae bacterium]|jgi:excisionase family DNA binding protein
MLTAAKTLLTPKELADAIGASESSLRRWVDSGRIQMSRTAGGHRRIPIEEAIRFIREARLPILRPDVLGLPAPESSSDDVARSPLSDEDRLYAALAGGDRKLARALTLGWFLQGRPLGYIFDGPITHALHRLGELFQHSDRGILIEHRATEMCVEIILLLKNLLPQAAEDAPVSLGGAPESDVYLVPTMMVGAVMQEAGYKDINFGPNTPVLLLKQAADEHQAKLVWLSVSVRMQNNRVRQQVEELARHLQQRDTHFVLGGRHVADLTPRGFGKVHIGQSMTELAAYAKALKH